MEGAGKLVDDEALREAISERGLGTPATRAAIIEGLLNEGYLRREGRDLIPSAKARQLMTLLSGLGVNELTSPELRSEEHTSELQSLMRISYAVFCLKKKKTTHVKTNIDKSLIKNNTTRPPNNF